MEAKDFRRRQFLAQGGTAARRALLSSMHLSPPGLFQAGPERRSFPGSISRRPAVRSFFAGRAEAAALGGSRCLVDAERSFLRRRPLWLPEDRREGLDVDGDGLVRQPLTLTRDQLMALPRRDVVYTMECAGNRGFPFFIGGIGTARWVGTPLAPVLEQAGIRDGGVEVVFYGADTGEEQVRDIKVQAPFARSMSIAEAMNPNLLLCYEMNGAPLPQVHGFPVRLIAPGWYGVANVKWLTRIEVRETRYEGRFMGRDYVTLREEQVGGKTLAVETSVGRTLLASAPARVTRQEVVTGSSDGLGWPDCPGGSAN